MFETYKQLFAPKIQKSRCISFLVIYTLIVDSVSILDVQFQWSRLFRTHDGASLYFVADEHRKRIK